jgi:hypothetical protein
MWYISSNVGTAVNDESQRIWKEAAMACFNVVFCHLQWKDLRQICQANWCADRDSSLEPPEYEAGILANVSHRHLI